MLNGAYQLLDITSKGRDEEGLPLPMAWVSRHDQLLIARSENGWERALGELPGDPLTRPTLTTRRQR